MFDILIVYKIGISKAGQLLSMKQLIFIFLNLHVFEFSCLGGNSCPISKIPNFLNYHDIKDFLKQFLLFETLQEFNFRLISK